MFDKFRNIQINGIHYAVLSEENVLCNNGMEHCYSLCANEKRPIYTNPVGVYVFELSIDAFMLSVETEENFTFIKRLFSSFESTTSEGAEVYFEKIDGWEELNVIGNIDELFGNKRIIYR